MYGCWLQLDDEPLIHAEVVRAEFPDGRDDRAEFVVSAETDVVTVSAVLAPPKTFEEYVTADAVPDTV